MAIASFTLKGHQSSVNCLACQGSYLLSGSDDKTARLWDLRTHKTSHCFRAHAEVTSAAFASPSADGTEPLKGPFAKQLSIFLSTEHAVLEYDLRQAQSPIVQDATRSLTEDFQIQEEINQLDTASPRRILAASDDMGTVRIWEEGSNLRIMQDSSHEPFLMTCCRFRSGGQIISGGTNCRLYLWDIGRPHKPLDVLTVPRQDTGVQICNPPMVHCVSWSPSGRLVAAGLGDGSIQIASVLKKKLVPLSRLQEGHADSVVSLCFPNFGAAANNDRLLASAGTDGMIILWDLDHSVGGTKATDPRRVLSEELLLGLSEVEAASQPENEPRLLFSIPHQIKANMMVSSQTNTLFVADTGKAITGYCVPLQSTSPD